MLPAAVTEFKTADKNAGALKGRPCVFTILFCAALAAAFMPLYTHIMRHTVYQMAHSPFSKITVSPFLPLPVIFVPGVPIIKSTCIMERFTPAAVI